MGVRRAWTLVTQATFRRKVPPMAALIRAIEDHRIDLVRQLLDLGVDVNQVDEQGRTPLIVAMMH